MDSATKCATPAARPDVSRLRVAAPKNSSEALARIVSTLLQSTTEVTPSSALDQPLARRDIDPEGTGQHDRLVARLLEAVHHMPADDSGASRYRDAHRCSSRGVLRVRI